MSRKSEWVKVSRSEPCQICKRPDYCTRSADGAVAKCMRIESGKPAKGSFGGWIHRLADPLPRVEPKPEQVVKPRVNWTDRAKKMYSSSAGQKTRVELAKSLGVEIDSLEQLRVGCGYDRNGTPFSSWPERHPDGRIAGIVRRYQDGSKKTMYGSGHGLYFARQWWVTPGPVLCPEGGSDTAALISIGICAVGRFSNAGGVDLLAKLLRDTRKQIIILGERDEKPDKRGREETPQCRATCRGCPNCYPGWSGAVSTAARLREMLRRDVEAAMTPAKDVREWLKQQDGFGSLVGLALLDELEPIGNQVTR